LQTRSERLLAAAGSLVSLLVIATVWWFIVANRESELKDAGRERLMHMARHDILTELPNRHVFQERMNEALALTADGVSFAVLCIDLDHFKDVNDLLGHSIGDALIKKVAGRLQASIRDVDFVARIGGDEFAA
jgi:GGDEF domain-containing protein